MITSHSDIDNYQRCKFRWHLGSGRRRGLTPLVSAPSLNLGKFIHTALETWMKDESRAPQVTFMEEASAARKEIQTTYHTQTNREIGDEALAKIDDIVALGYAMMSNYVEHWKQSLFKDFALIGTEQNFVVDIPGTLHTQEYIYDATDDTVKLVTYDTPRCHKFQGKLDGLLSKNANEVYILDHKSYSNRPKEEVLKLSQQFMRYVWAGTQLDLPIVGLAYNGLWSRAAPPKTVDGRTGVLADLFCRIKIDYNPVLVQNAGEDLALITNEMANNPAIYPHRTYNGSCHWDCRLESLCAAHMYGEDTDYVTRTEYTQRPPVDPEELTDD